MITLQGVNKWFGPLQVLADCNAAIDQGEVVVICGPSGSGKSTLIKCINGLEEFQKGQIIVNEQSIKSPKTNIYRLRSKVGMVFQKFRALSASDVHRKYHAGSPEGLETVARRKHGESQEASTAGWVVGPWREVSLATFGGPTTAGGNR
jgi:ABC-type polar amino acid transport system ATPase subunit